MNQSDTNNVSEWHTVVEACRLLSISRSSLYRRIKAGEIESKDENGIRLIHIPTVSDVGQELTQLVEQLKSENEYLRQELSKANTELSDTKSRSDTIILTLTQELTQTRLQLPSPKKPFWKRIFRKS